jgi:hypothetical protein
LGFDVGNATVVGYDGVNTVIMPSRYSFSADTAVALLRDDGHLVEVGGRAYVVGTAAYDQPGETSLLGTDDRYTSPVCLPFLFAALAALYPDSPALTVTLATGVPIALYEQNAAGIRALYTRDERFSYRGKPYRALIQAVTVHREGATAINLIPDDERAGNLIIVDGGGKTTNIALYKNGRYRDGYTYPYGIERAMQLFKTIRPLDTQERHDLQRAYVARKPYTIAYQGKRERIDTAFRSFMAGYATDMLDALSVRVPFAAADRVYLLGGARYFIESTFNERGIRARTFEGAAEATNARAYHRELGARDA